MWCVCVGLICVVCVGLICVVCAFSSYLLSDHVGTAGQAIIQMGYWAPTLSSKAMEDLILYLKVTMF